jgi:UDP-N-acetylmuramoyl-tripeptide--D-alanyl-D-alanine ligase
VAQAKGELFAGLDRSATAVINSDDPQISAIAAGVAARCLYFGEGKDVRAEQIEVVGVEATRFRLVTPAGAATVEMPLMGRHNVTNALAAAAVAVVLEVGPDAIAAGLGRVELPPMRLAAERLANGVVVINDAYNANPDSVVAALATLAESASGRKIVVLGDMLELGRGAAAMHAEVGAAAAGVDPVLLCAVGEHAEDIRRGATEAGMSPERAIAATSHEIAAAEVERAWRRDDTVLVKGSRGSRMETVIETLRRSATT